MRTMLDSPERQLTAPSTTYIFDINETSQSSVSIFLNGEMVSRPISLGVAEFDAIGDALLLEWQNEIGHQAADLPLQVSIRQNMRDAESQRRHFADAGNNAFRSLVDAMDGVVRDHFVTQIAGLSVDSPEQIVFMGSRSFPWRLLYARPGDPSQPIEDPDANDLPEDRFLGIAALVDHAPRITPVTRRGPGRTAPIAVHDDFTSFDGGDIEQLSLLLKTSGGLTPVNISSEKELARALKRDDARLVYLYCHGTFGPGTGGRLPQQLLLRPNAAVTAAWISAQLKGRLKENLFSTSPIAFINACQGGVYGSEVSSGVTEAFLTLGAQATVAPLVNIPILFAGHYGKRVLTSLVQGSFVGEAVREATTYFAQEDGNLLGLTYASVNGRGANVPST